MEIRRYSRVRNRISTAIVMSVLGFSDFDIQHELECILDPDAELKRACEILGMPPPEPRERIKQEKPTRMTDAVLMSIQPQHVRKIFSREKRFEFRRRINRGITRVVIYETAPTSAIVGWFTVIDVLSEPPETLWPFVEHEAGITREQYDAYFAGCATAHAIQIGGVTRCEPIPLAQYGIQRPPQSWMYFHGVIQ